MERSIVLCMGSPPKDSLWETKPNNFQGQIELSLPSAPAAAPAPAPASTSPSPSPSSPSAPRLAVAHLHSDPISGYPCPIETADSVLSIPGTRKTVGFRIYSSKHQSLKLTRISIEIN